MIMEETKNQEIDSVEKCGPFSLQRVTLCFGILDLICCALLLITFVLGSSLMIAFQIVGNEGNATRTLDMVTDTVFGTMQKNYDDAIRARKDVAEDMGVWLIVTFLIFVDFVIACIFLDGVRQKNARKIQTWLSIRPVVMVVFGIIMIINLMYGSTPMNAIPDGVYGSLRIIGITLGYKFYKLALQRERLGKHLTSRSIVRKYKDYDDNNDNLHPTSVVGSFPGQNDSVIVVPVQDEGCSSSSANLSDKLSSHRCN